MPDGTWREYAWVDESVPIAFLPEELQEMLPKQDAPPAARTPRTPAPTKRGRPTCKNNPESIVSEAPTGAAEVMLLLAKLKDSRAAGGRNSDWLRVGFALKRNEELLRKAGRGLEADQMLNLFDIFSMRSPSQYPGRQKIESDFASLKPGFEMKNPTTMGTVVAMAKEDSGSPTRPVVDVKMAQDLINFLSNRFPDVLPKGTNDEIGDVTAETIPFVISGKKGYVDIRTLDVFTSSPRAFIGHIPSDSVKIIKPLSVLQKDVETNLSFRFSRPTETVALLCAESGETASWTNPWGDNQSVTVNYTGQKKPSTITSVPKLVAMSDIVAKSLESYRRAELPVIQNICTNNGIIQNSFNLMQSSESKIVPLQNSILERAKKEKLQKANGIIYHPINPCAYIPGDTYKKFVSKHFKGAIEFRENVDNVQKLEKFLTDFKDLPELPELNPDRHLLSFSNGALNTVSMEFHAYDDMETDDGHPLLNHVARHHIDRPWTASPDTPILDKILDHQFEEETKTFFLAMMGRLLFRMRELDRWECSPYLYGTAGTGKSLLLSCIKKLYREDAVKYFADEKDGRFALEGIADAEIVIGTDMPADIEKAIDPEVYQKMCSAEPIVVNQKGSKQFHIPRWNPPVCLASNFSPAWKNRGDRIGRRAVPFCFANVVTERDPSLEEKLEAELPNIAYRFLTAYHTLRERLGNKDLAQNLPEDVLGWAGEVRESTSDVFRFLSLHEDERVINGKKIKFEQTVGHIILRKDFVELYKQWVDEDDDATDKFVNDEAMFAHFGFSSPSSKLQICTFCLNDGTLKRHRKGCCDAYNTKARTTRHIIEGMKIVSL
nr:DNA primase domain-containing protein [Oceanusvirus sp.]